MSKREILRVIALLLLLTVTATVFLACKKKGQETPTPTPSDNSLLAPDYAPPAQEEGASNIESEGSEGKLTPGGGGGAVGMTYQDKVSIDLTTKKATLYFANPSRSYNNVVLQLVMQDTLIFQSGLLTPGKQLNEIALADGIAERLQDGGYNAKFVVSFYDPDTNEKAIVNSELPVTVDVSH